MKYLLLTMTMLISLSSSALKIEVPAMDFSRSPQLKKQITEVMKTINSDRKKLGLKGPNYFFITLKGKHINGLDMIIRWYDTRMYMDELAQYEGYTIVGNDTILFYTHVGFNVTEKLNLKAKKKKRKIKIPFENFHPSKVNTKIKQVNWYFNNFQKKIVHRIDSFNLGRDYFYYDPYDIVTP